MNAETVYRLLPVWAQNMAVSAQGFRLRRRRFGSVYQAHRERLPETYGLSREEVEHLQLRSLKSFINFAKANSPFYAEHLSGFEASDLSDLQDFKHWPTVDKELLRKHIDKVIALPDTETVPVRTGGTTGKSLIVRMAKSDVQRRMAELWHFREQLGVRKGMRLASFTGKTIVHHTHERPRIFWRTNTALRQRLFSSFYISMDNIDAYVDALNKFQPEIIDGLANSITDVCRYARAAGLKFEFQPKGVFPTAEPLYAEHRAIIKEMLGVDPKDQYASSEGAPFIFECEHGNMHYAMHTGIIENDDKGNAVVTSFTTHGTPLIRYSIGDRIVFSPRVCTCGWDTPIVSKIEGRTNDYLVSARGARIYASNFANAIKVFPNSVVQSQFIQPSLEEVVVRVVIDHNRFDRVRDSKLIKDEVRKRLGYEVKVFVKIVDEIPRTAGGKVRFILNELGI